MAWLKRFWRWLAAAALLLAAPAILLVWGFALPAQYDASFLGELKYKAALLDSAPAPRLVIVGGSAAAFGVDSTLLAEQLPAYTPVNFGMYAALGTQVMLELSADALQPGDIVIIMPEQQHQTLSCYFNAEAMWQALDGAFWLLPCLDSSHWGALVGAYPQFAAEKLNYWRSGAPPQPTGVYSRASFDANGDIAAPCLCNTMPGEVDANTPLVLDAALPDADFAALLNDYAAAAAARGAVVYYHYPPMNALAVQGDVQAAYAALDAMLDFEILGDPRACVMPSGWFYDTNFHLNSAGKTVYTRLLVRDIKAALGDTTPTDIPLPAMPTPADPAVTGGDNSDADCFTYTAENGALTLTGLTAEGKNRQSLTVPAEIDGQPVTAIAAGCFAGAQRLRAVTIQRSIAHIGDGAFRGCTALRALHIQQPQPSAISVGQQLMEGADFTVYVAADALNSYKLDYNWGAIRRAPGGRGIARANNFIAVSPFHQPL